MLNAQNLSLMRGTTRVLTNADLTLEPGSITLFLGPSGAGKTTLLRALAGLTPLQSGTITIDGINLSTLSQQERTRFIGYVFQQFNLFPHMTVLQNCTQPLTLQGLSQTEAHTKALAQLAAVDMAAYADRYPHQLSGGQQQRVAIARALALTPRVLLLDEPTASLDTENSRILIALLRSMSEQGIMVGIATQDLFLLQELPERSYRIEHGTCTLL